MDALESAVSLLEISGISGNLAEKLRKKPGQVTGENGKLYVLARGNVFQCPDTAEGRTILEAIAGEDKGYTLETEPESITKAWKTCLQQGGEENAKRLAEGYGVKQLADRCVILFQSRQEGEKLRLPSMTELMPGEEDEALIAISPQEIAMVRNAAEQTQDEMTEYAEAVVEFAESEAGLSLTAGIGSICFSLAETHDSYTEAREALRIGRKFHPGDSVHVYQKQILERLLASVPEEERIRCRKQIFNEKTERLLNEEMRETIRVFFENDLNLSTTARQLYLHRNTLTYRLDRVRRETGLDLRSFRDAAAFKAVMECPGETDPGKRKGG